MREHRLGRLRVRRGYGHRDTALGRPFEDQRRLQEAAAPCAYLARINQRAIADIAGVTGQAQCQRPCRRAAQARQALHVIHQREPEIL